MKYRFSGHQTFVFRYGWLEKGVRAAAKFPSIFSADDAIVQLGVGKNMVESIRHWCLVTQLLQEKWNFENCRRLDLQPTFLAKQLLLEGWDPFLENDASLWLIHWLLISNPSIGTSWQLAFGHFHKPDFSKRELVDFVKSFAEKQSIQVRESSLTRDIDCFLRTYLPLRSAEGHADTAEETFNCPLQELSLIQTSPDDEFYRFAIGPKPTLPAAVFVFALNEYFNRTKSDLNTMSVQECLYGIQSPGQAFKLDENSLVEYVDTIDNITDGAITLDETAGLKQIYRRQKINALRLLERHYHAEAR